ncbi:MAG: argininosuccinate lyase [Bacillota bacterium]|nr:argininosuccinate lyase [Bacillota bacterium]
MTHEPPSAFTDARLGKPQADELKNYVTAPGLAASRRGFFDYCLVDLAHTVMLAEQGILKPGVARAILGSLVGLYIAGPDALPWDPALGSHLLQVESYLAAEIGEDAAGRMHTGRSRNDLGTCAKRLVARGYLLQVMENVIAYQATLIEVARRHNDTMMPGYTHLQHAQPVTLGHHLTGEFYVSERDFQRLVGAYARTNLNTLGGAALAGTGWAVDRNRTAELLGFDGLVVNSRDASGLAIDYLAEIAATLAILMVNLGRLASDLYIWSSWEFNLIELADDLCGSSSIMPQKKNPYLLEKTRGLSGEAIGWVAGILGALKMASTSDRDLGFSDGQDYILPSAVESTNSALSAMRETVRTMIVNPEVMRARAGAFWSTASNLADEIVRQRDLPFRTAHGIVGRLVRNCVRDGVSPAEVTPAHLDQAGLEITGKPVEMPVGAISDALDPERFLHTRETIGSVNPREVLRMVEHAEELIRREQEHVAKLRAGIEAGKARLATAVGQVLREEVNL